MSAENDDGDWETLGDDDDYPDCISCDLCGKEFHRDFYTEDARWMRAKEQHQNACAARLGLTAPAIKSNSNSNSGSYNIYSNSNNNGNKILNVKVVIEKDLLTHHGPDLVDFDFVVSFAVESDQTLSGFKQTAYDRLGVAVKAQRYWIFLKRPFGQPCRPDYCCSSKDELVPFSTLRDFAAAAEASQAQADLVLYLECCDEIIIKDNRDQNTNDVRAKENFYYDARSDSYKFKDNMKKCYKRTDMGLFFIKFFEPGMPGQGCLTYVGRIEFSLKDTLLDHNAGLVELSHVNEPGKPTNATSELYFVVEAACNDLRDINPKVSVSQTYYGDGDIIVCQRRKEVLQEHLYNFPFKMAVDYYIHLCRMQAEDQGYCECPSCNRKFHVANYQNFGMCERAFGQHYGTCVPSPQNQRLLLQQAYLDNNKTSRSNHNNNNNSNNDNDIQLDEEEFEDSSEYEDIEDGEEGEEGEEDEDEDDFHEHKYECPNCGAGFATKRELDKHTGETTTATTTPTTGQGLTRRSNVDNYGRRRTTAAAATAASSSRRRTATATAAAAASAPAASSSSTATRRRQQQQRQQETASLQTYLQSILEYGGFDLESQLHNLFHGGHHHHHHYDDYADYDEEMMRAIWSQMAEPPVARPASSKTIAKLARQKCVKSRLAADQNCSICLEGYEDNQTIISLKCSATHIFHEICLVEWLKVQSHCPICRVPVK